MRILLLAMPDTAASLDRVMKFPNLGLCSLAAQVPGHEVRILDLVLRPKGVLSQVLSEVRTFDPDLVGYSAMSFQYDTARALALARQPFASNPGQAITAGGPESRRRRRSRAPRPRERRGRAGTFEGRSRRSDARGRRGGPRARRSRARACR